MGRNAIPKLDEWRDGRRYSFRTVKGDDIPKPDDGEFIVYEVEIASGRASAPNRIETLATAHADGFQEVMAAMFEAGLLRGRREGRAEKLNEVRQALGLTAVTGDRHD